MPESKDLAGACLSIVNELAKRGKSWRDKQNTEDLLATINYVDRAFPRIPETRLTGWVTNRPPQGDFGTEWVHGPPAFTGRERPRVLTVARMRWDFTGATDEVSLLVGLVIRDADYVRKSQPVPVTAYRFETGKGNHEFGHAQPTTRLRKGGADIPGAATETVNESSPAFPLDCTGPCGIVASAALSILGGTDYGAMLSTSREVNSALRPFRAQLPRRSVDSAVTRPPKPVV